MITTYDGAAPVVASTTPGPWTRSTASGSSVTQVSRVLQSEEDSVLSEIVPFQFDDYDIRVITIDGVPWWVASDVCFALDISDVSSAVSRLDEADTGTARVSSGSQTRNVRIINESGLWDLILDSRKPEAKRFRKWVTSVVLPRIRETGAYTPVPQTFAEALELAARQQRAIEKQRVRIDKLEPEAKAYREWQVSEGTVYIEDWAKQRGIGLTRNRAFEILREVGVLFRRRTYGGFGEYHNLPIKAYEHLFEVVEEPKGQTGRYTKVPRLTPDGQVELAKLLLDLGYIKPRTPETNE